MTVSSMARHGAYVEAARQGANGELQPNQVFTPGNEVEFEVPDITVRNYFMMNDPAKAGEIATVLARLAIVDIDVQMLTAPLEVPDFVPYGRSPVATTMPAGTYVISMAQGDKHFIQTCLNEGSYTPFEYFYDLTGWSAMILQNVPGGYCASELAEDMQATTLTASDAAEGARAVARAQPVPEKLRKLRAKGKADGKADGKAGPAQNAEIVVLRATAGDNPGESFDWLAHKMREDWQLPYTEMLPAEFAAGIPPTVSVLVVPSVNAATVFAALGAAGREAIATWVASGGHMVTWQGSAQLASDLGLSLTQFDPPSSSSPGSFFRLMMDVAHPLADGIGPETFMYYRSTLPVMRSFQHRIVGFFPAVCHPELKLKIPA